MVCATRYYVIHEAPLTRSYFTVRLASYRVWAREEGYGINGVSKDRTMHFLYFDSCSLIGWFQSFVHEEKHSISFEQRHQLIKEHNLDAVRAYSDVRYPGKICVIAKM